LTNLREGNLIESSRVVSPSNKLQTLTSWQKEFSQQIS